MSIFFLDQKMYYKLVRQENSDQELFFEETSKIYLGLVNEKKEDCTIEGFSRKLFEND